MTHDEEAPASRPSGQLRTFLIADVRGYTRFTHEHGDEEAARLAARFAAITRSGIQEHAGELLELRGDEALGVFTSARDAIRAAVDLQLRLTGSFEEPPFPLGVGIGLDAGEGVPVEGGLRSGALNLAARLCSLAASGQILASETTVSLARRVEGIRFQPRGAERIKGFEQPVRVVEVLADSLADGSVSVRAGGSRVSQRLLLAALAVIAVLAGGVLALTLLGARGGSGTDGVSRVALVLGADPRENPLAAQYGEGLVRADRAFDLETSTLVTDDVDPSRADLDQLSMALAAGDFDLVLWAGYGVAADALAERITKDPDSRVVYVDASLGGSQLEGRPNVTAIHLDSKPAAELAGYLSGLMEARRAARVGERAVVSVVGGLPVPAVEELVLGFTAGARRAERGVRVDTDYSETFSDRSVCEEIANRQIDGGSHVVFAAAGECGTGALVAAGIRGVWGVGVDRDQSHLGPHVLVSVVKRSDRAVELAVRRFLDGTLPPGETLELGIEDDAVGIAGLSAVVPAGIRKKVAREAARLRAQEEAQP